MKSALVTGGLGFIGSHLVDRLLSEGLWGVVIDNFVNNCVDNMDCEILAGDITEVLLTEDIFVDSVFHLASTVGPVGVLSQSGEMGNSIVRDTVALRDFCIEEGIKYTYVSTSEIYGDVKDWHEDSIKVFPAHYTVRSEYAAGKMTSEISIVNKARVADLSYTIIHWGVIR